MARTAFRIQTTQSIHAAPLVTVCEIKFGEIDTSWIDIDWLGTAKELLETTDFITVTVLSNSGRAPRDRLIAVDAIVSVEVDEVWTERLARGVDRWVAIGRINPDGEGA